MTTLAANTSTTFTINVDQVITLTGASVTLTATLTNQKGGDVVVKFAGQKLRDTPVFSAGSTGTVTLVNGPNPLTYVVSDTAMGNVVATTNPLTGNTIGIYGQVNGVPNQVIALGSSSVVLPTFQPYKIAGFGDSRVDQNLATPDLGSVNTSFGSEITPMLWACALLGDAAYTRSYGIGGDVASNWSAASAGTNRFTYGRTIADCVRSDLDGVIIQYGVNDARGAVSAALIAGYLQGLCTEIMKSGKLVFFESIMPPSSTYTSAAAVKAITDAANVLMAAWLAQFPKQAIYMNVNAAITDASGWMLPAYTDDGLHLTQKGALAIARVEAPLMRTLLPARSGTFPGPDSKNPNMLNLVSPSAFINIDTGTVSASAVASGLDATNGYYTDLFICSDLDGEPDQLIPSAQG